MATRGITCTRERFVLRQTNSLIWAPNHSYVTYGYQIAAVFDLVSNMSYFKKDFQILDVLSLFAFLIDTRSMVRFSSRLEKFEIPSMILAGTDARFGSFA